LENQLKLGCVVMAAGNAKRYGENKLTAPFQGRSLILRTLESIPADLFDSVVVVTQYPEIMELARSFQFTAVHNHHPEYGVSHTIQLGLTHLGDCHGALFLVSDQPLLRRESVARLTFLWMQQPEKIAAMSHNGVQGNPCLFPARFFQEVMELEGDTGGSAVIRRHKDDLVLLEIDSQELEDVDTPTAMEQLQETLHP
jgi:molybdenum cofactor cytidylyltransferase